MDDWWVESSKIFDVGSAKCLKDNINIIANTDGDVVAESTRQTLECACVSVYRRNDGKCF